MLHLQIIYIRGSLIAKPQCGRRGELANWIVVGEGRRGRQSVGLLLGFEFGGELADGELLNGCVDERGGRSIVGSGIAMVGWGRVETRGVGTSGLIKGVLAGKRSGTGVMIVSARVGNG